MSTSFCFVLIRGLLREQRHWGDFVTTLQNQYPDAKIMTLDIPGNGCWYQQISPASIEAFTDALRQQLSGNLQHLNLIAISMGGMIALDWMQRYPNEIKSAVLINTSVRPYNPFYQRLRWQIYPVIFYLLCLSPANRERLILWLTSNRYSNAPDLLQQWQIWQQQQPTSNLSARHQLLAAAKFSLTARPNHPILMIASRKDRLVDYQCSLRLQQSWQKEYREHDTAGHDLPLDDPQWLSQTIRQWLEKI